LPADTLVPRGRVGRRRRAGAGRWRPGPVADEA